MVDPIQEKLTRWSLERIQFLFNHIEGFIEDENKDLRERARQFVLNTELNQVNSLVDVHPSDPRLPSLVLQSLSGYFESGLLLQRSPAQDTSHWWATDIFCKGNAFHLELQDQVRASQIVPEMTPLQVHRAPAKPLLEKLKVQFLLPGTSADAYLLRPTPNLAYLLVTNLAPPWSVDHLAHTQRLVNKCFIY